MSSIVEHVAALVVGTVETVAPDEIHVILDTDAPQATALNTGVPSRFPRINGFVLVPNEAGAVVGLVSWLGVERSAFPKRTGLKDFGLLDLPFPLRKMTLNPVGTLRAVTNADGEVAFELDRGVAVFPSVGDPVMLPTAKQLGAIIEAQGVNRRVPIGRSTLSANALVSVDPDKLFGRHLAVLGNTGSGKSCSVAGLIRWSLNAAKENINEACGEELPNARFIVLDPNGEYLTTFDDLPDVKVFQVEPTDGNLPLTVPAWMWNSAEWSAFAQAAPGAQRPMLLQGLRGMRASAGLGDPPESKLRRTLESYRVWLTTVLAQGPAGYGGEWRVRLDCGQLLTVLREDIPTLVAQTPEHGDGLDNILNLANEIHERCEYVSGAGKVSFNAFTKVELDALYESMSEVIDALPTPSESEGPSEDAPTPFDVEGFADYLDLLARSSEFAGMAQFVHTLNLRIRSIIADRRLGRIVNPEDEESIEAWLAAMIGETGNRPATISVIDLSLVPTEILQVVIAVIARLIFGSLQRYRKLKLEVLPTVLVLEEAHTFVRRAHRDDEASSAPARMCRETFEKVAREGRKFGLGLVLSSQRPSELSQTVLAQCNTFLLHRIVNDRDQQLVSRLVPDNLGGLLRELPNLPSRQAILLGWATPVPILVEMNELPEAQRPRSADPNYWAVWTGDTPRPVDWAEITRDWIGAPPEPDAAPE